jgi:single-strand DNA-binding protein
MAYDNSVILVGRLTQQPELKSVGDNVSVLSFSIAQTKRTSKGKDHPESNFFDCVAWRNTAEFICKYFSKGMRIGIAGHLDTQKWTDADGKNHKRTIVAVDEANFVDPKNTTDKPQPAKAEVNNTEEEYTEPDVSVNDEEESDNELPF